MSRPKSHALPKHPLRQPVPSTAQPSNEVLCFRRIPRAPPPGQMTAHQIELTYHYLTLVRQVRGLFIQTAERSRRHPGRPLAQA